MTQAVYIKKTLEQFDYTVRGGFTAPAGTRLNERGNGVILPDGSELKIWEVFEHHPAQPEPKNLTFDEAAALGVNYEPLSTEVEQGAPWVIGGADEPKTPRAMVEGDLYPRPGHRKAPFTLENFRASRKETNDLGSDEFGINDVSLIGVSGYVYCDSYYISLSLIDDTPHWHLILAVDEFIEPCSRPDGLERLESMLYFYSITEGSNEPPSWGYVAQTLTAELTSWQMTHGYPLQCARELLLSLEGAHGSHQHYLNDFCERWEYVEEKAEAAGEKI